MDHKKNLPNYITIVRLTLTPLLGLLVLLELKWWFLALSLFLFLTDILDGFIARRYNLISDLGRKLDSIADLALTSMIVVGWFYFFREYVLQQVVLIGFLILLNLMVYIYPLIMFRKVVALHLRLQQFGFHFFMIMLTVCFLRGPEVWMTWALFLYSSVMVFEVILFLHFMTMPEHANLHSLLALLKERRKTHSDSG